MSNDLLKISRTGGQTKQYPADDLLMQPCLR